MLTQHVTPFRPTVDIDMLGIHVSNNQEALKKIMQEIGSINLPDGVRFKTDSVTSQVIKEDAEYEGLRFSFVACLGVIKSKMQIDIGFDDVVPGGFINERLPTILDDSEITSILHYPLWACIKKLEKTVPKPGITILCMMEFATAV